MERKLTYISLFSSAGVGCYGFKMNGFDCIVTNELIERRIDVQKCNKKCKYESGYIQGDITNNKIMQQLFKEIEEYKKKEQITDVDVVIATPPCQGMSVANHKKTSTEIQRNSLVVEAINMIKKISPRFFVFENVQAFMNTACYDDGIKKKIGDAIKENLSGDYEYVAKVLNFKNYGANSSRTRTLVIGVRSDLANFISPVDLFPEVEEEKTLRQLIFDMPRLSEMGKVSDTDIYHGFKAYSSEMRSWIHDLREGESAFDNVDPLKRPHKVIDGEIIENVNKNGDKYTRQYWDKVAPCIHTRNDIMASQNTVHPEDDRVFSIRELMIMMNIPAEFKWVMEDEKQLNNLSEKEKCSFMKKNEINIRQSIGEAVPTVIMKKIALNIKKALSENNPSDKEMKKKIVESKLEDITNLHSFIINNTENYSLNALSRIAEIANSAQNETAAFYTDKNTLIEIFDCLPEIEKDEISVLEPSVGTGNFIPFIIKKYETHKHVSIDVCDINADSLKTFKLLLERMRVPKNIEIHFINSDFLEYQFSQKYDLVVGNPPFLKLSNSKQLSKYRKSTSDVVANNTSAFFLEKAYSIADFVVMILPKYFLHNSDFKVCRDITNKYAIRKIIDFGEKGFKGVLIETICIFVSTTAERGKTECYSTTHDIRNVISQNLLTDDRFPNWMLYRNAFFNHIASSMYFDIFSCFRDRQITNKVMNDEGEVWVVKSRNVSQDGESIIHEDGYDAYVQKEDVSHTNVYKYLDRSDVFLSPNMTYYPRVVRKPKGVLVNGSVAIFEKKRQIDIEESDLTYYASDEFREFYSIARNLSTRSLNLDNTSVYYFGIRRE